MNDTLYVRINRDGESKIVDITTLTEEEFNAWAKDINNQGAIEKWLWVLWRWIKEH